jgi:pimeloyl-ACP methyl ester carboxylesterase
MAASLAPERVRFLVTIATPHPAAVKPNLRLLWRARHFMSLSRRNAAAMVRAREYAYVDELVQRWSPAWHMPPDATRAVKDVFANDACLDAALAYYRAAVADRRVPKELRTPVRVPSTVFAGSDDGVLEVSDFERARRCFAAPHQLVVLPGGHFLHREHPARFIEALLAALPHV